MPTASSEHPGGPILPQHLQHGYVHGEPLPQHLFGGPRVSKKNQDKCLLTRPDPGGDRSQAGFSQGLQR